MFICFYENVSMVVTCMGVFEFLADVDECKLSLANCASGATCLNTYGGYRCYPGPFAGNVNFIFAIKRA
jgi:Calcium-binding EGF domain